MSVRRAGVASVGAVQAWGGAVDGGRGGARAGGDSRTGWAMKTVAGRDVGMAAAVIIGGVGRAAAKLIRQAAHLAPARPLDPLCSPSTPTEMVWGPSAEQMTMGWPGVEAASAAKGRRLPNTMANVAARKASERRVDQVSA